MALDLALTYEQSNDAKRVILTDDTGDYSGTNAGGWGTPNPATSEVVVTTDTTVGRYHLTLTPTVTISNGTETTYDVIDLRDTFSSEFTKTSGMTYELTPAMLISGGNSMGTATDTFVDGVYKFIYKLTDANTGTITDSVEYNFLVDGNVRIALYEEIAVIPEVYNCQIFNGDDQDYRTIVNTNFKYTYFQGMLSNPDISEKDDKIAILNTLERLLDD